MKRTLAKQWMSQVEAIQRSNNPWIQRLVKTPKEEYVDKVMEASPYLWGLQHRIRAALRLERFETRSARPKKPAPYFRAALVARQRKARPRYGG